MSAPAQGGGSLAGLGIAAKIMAKYGYKVSPFFKHLPSLYIEFKDVTVMCI
jgi:hypothetical protein